MKKIYLDYAASTPIDPRVMEAMIPHLKNNFGNSMSIHSFGRQAYEAIETSRKTVSDVINADPREIFFTGSATESNNLALKGVAIANKNRGKNHLITTTIEHPCILESGRWLSRQGFKITYLSVDKDGLVDIKKLQDAIKKETVLVSIIHANNEIGTIQDIETIGSLCREKGVYFHTDAAQSFAREAIDVKKMNIDLLTASSHKMYGPKGVSCLYVRRGVIIEPILHGGGQEAGLRSSTVNVPAIVGLAKACQILQNEGEEENRRLTNLRDTLIRKILTRIKKTRLNGHPKKRLANNINISFTGVEGESLMMELDFQGIAVSTGSACSSKTLEPSHVLLAIGLPPASAHGSLRISLGRWTTKENIAHTIKILSRAVNKLRKISPYG